MNMKEHSRNKAPIMSEGERLQLAEKLDEELDTYINSLEKKPYTEGWPEDRWEEEMEKHPFFMTKSPEAGEKLSPLLEGIQQLKYDKDENTPEELAVTYKEDGNFNFKCKKYRVAVISYTEGLRQKCDDNDINAQLYNNRAAAHFFLKNYRSSLQDCHSALKLKQPYPKAQIRAAQCCFHLGLFNDCIGMCDAILLRTPKDKEALRLRTNAVSSKKTEERNMRKKAIGKRKDEGEEKQLLKAIQDRRIQIYTEECSPLFLEDLEPQYPGGVCSRVYMVDSRLVWPVIFLYPEYKISDLIQEFHEDCSFQDQLNEVFRNKPDWDVEAKYRPSNLQIYFEDLSTGNMCQVPKQNTLSKIVSDQRFKLRGGTPCFFIVVQGSEVESSYMNM